MVVNAEDEFDENAVNPIEFQSTFAILLNEGNQIGFTKEDFSSTARWNKLIRERNKKTASFSLLLHDRGYQLAQVHFQALLGMA